MPKNQLDQAAKKFLILSVMKDRLDNIFGFNGKFCTVETDKTPAWHVDMIVLRPHS